jgi:hypothetical protein
MTTSAVRTPVAQDSATGVDSQTFRHPAEPDKRFEPQSVRSLPIEAQAKPPTLRMYTEDEVSEMLQVSVSQLRKWRMKRNRRNAKGPPFKKIGRLVRYPEQGLREYINGK